MVEVLCNGKVHYRRPENHKDVEEIKMLISSGQAPSYAIRPDKCECDNTHEQNHTVCRYCWDIGVRYATAWWRGHNKKNEA